MIETHGNPKCSHCALSEAIIAWRSSEGAAQLVADQRRDSPEQAYRYSDDQLVAFAVMRALGILVIDVVMEEPDARIKVELMNNFTDATVAHQIGLATGRWEG